MSKLCSERSEFYDDVVKVFSSSQAQFLSRIGGSDTDALIDYMACKTDEGAGLEDHLLRHFSVVERYNGFYDLGTDKVASYIRYLDVLHDCYLNIERCTFVHSHFLSLYFRNQIDKQFVTENVPNKEMLQSLVSTIIDRPTFTRGYPYKFVEGILINPFTLFSAFAKILSGKKVLLLSPFTESISLNFSNRHKFFSKDYLYPDFTPVTINTPITYGGMPIEYYPDSDWHETVDRLTREISLQDFDIALLSCGSYAMPLGQYISSKMARHAIYVGGVLQLFFGIMGRRYENSFFLDQINREFFINPVERARYEQMLPKSDHIAREAFGAYF